MTILVLDIGSSSVRALLFDDAARLVTQVARRHQFTTQPPGAATFDAEPLRERVEACIDEILRVSRKLATSARWRLIRSSAT